MVFKYVTYTNIGHCANHAIIGQLKQFGEGHHVNGQWNEIQL